MNEQLEIEFEPYDSGPETRKHIGKVLGLLTKCAEELVHRGEIHDASKLVIPEKEYFDRYTPELTNMVYGSEEYRESCRKLKPAIDHHYSLNSHHPQFYEDGVAGMNLFDVMEMLMDWKASTERGKDGDIRKSLDINASRFGISKQLKAILSNTIEYLKW